jgi:hypothetical protein
MLILDAAKRREQELRERGQIPFYVPQPFAQQLAYARQQVAMLKHEDLMRNDATYREDWIRAHKDEKPDMVTVKKNGRQVMVVGAGTGWRLDLEEIGLRKLEQPDPAKDPKWQKRHDIINDIDRAAELNKAAKKGSLGTGAGKHVTIQSAGISLNSKDVTHG